MGRIIETEKFEVESSKIARDYSIALLGDLHIRYNTKYSFIDDISSSVCDTNPDLIILDGDMVYNISDFYNKRITNRLECTIGELKEIAPVFIVPGNHDIKESLRHKYVDAIQYFNRLDSISNTEVLHNKSTKFEELNIVGFSPREKTYHYPHKGKWIDMFSEDYLKSNISLDENDFNILATHSPQIISDPKLISMLKEELLPIDLIVCAHMHDGLMKKSNQVDDMGYSFNDTLSVLLMRLGKEHYCRGMHDVLNAKMIVTRGVRKWVIKCLLSDIIDKTKSHDITNIKLVKKL